MLRLRSYSRVDAREMAACVAWPSADGMTSADQTPVLLTATHHEVNFDAKRS